MQREVFISERRTEAKLDFLTQNAEQNGQQQQRVGGKHGNRGHTDRQGQQQAVEGALHTCRQEVTFSSKEDV